MAEPDLRSVPISALSSLDPVAASSGSLLIMPGPSPFAYLRVEFQEQPGLLPLINVTDRPFTIIPIAPGLGPFVAIEGAHLVVDLNRSFTATSGELRAGLAFVAGHDVGLVGKFGYGTSYITMDGGIYHNAEWSTTTFFEAWRFVVEVNNQVMTVVDSRLGLRI